MINYLLSHITHLDEMDDQLDEGREREREREKERERESEREERDNCNCLKIVHCELSQVVTLKPGEYRATA